jgi:hypothetical protein
VYPEEYMKKNKNKYEDIWYEYSQQWKLNEALKETKDAIYKFLKSRMEPHVEGIVSFALKSSHVDN